MPLHLISSNRFEHLLDALIAGIGSSPSVFEPDRVVVPSLAVRRRVELTTAERHGICANVQFRFLAEWLWEQIAKVVPGVDESSPFAQSRLAWRIHRVLGDAAFAHAPLARYLERADELMRYDLAVRLAELYDRYITYRSDWLDRWAAGESIGGAAGASPHEPWQAALWQRIVDELGAARRHPSVAFFEAIRKGTIDARAAGLPQVAHVFCLPSIPPLYVEMLRGLARWTTLHVYLLNPCEEYWLEIVAPRRLAELRARSRADYHETGNRLLAQWGAHTRANLRVVLQGWEAAMQETSHYEAPTTDTLLHRVQRSMLELTEIEPSSLAPVGAHDRSIEVHVCHSLTRELEVLQDQLLAMFAADPLLRPSDVLVVTPKLEDAAPLIEAVFGNVADARRIPFEITGRARSVENPAARALLDILALATSRFHASAVFEVLQQPMVARRFDVDANGLDAIRGWMTAAGIRWALNAEHRAALDLPALARHSFADGLDRLFLGYAVPAHTLRSLVDILPAGNVEGSEAVNLGSFSRMVRLLERLREDVARARPIGQWLQVARRIIESFLLPADEELDRLRELEGALRQLGEDVQRGGAEGTPLSVDVMRAALQRVLDDAARGGVPGGAVTFASMSSLRGLPYRVVCAIGLDDRAFPSIDRPLEFDLIAAAPRDGDRQRREEDRNVFLDLVVAARQRLYLSHAGRNIRDNAPLPPSVLISDLLDVLVPAIAEDAQSIEALQRAHRRLVVEHPLQPFSASYFSGDGDPRAKSFNAEYCDALRQRVARGARTTLTAVGPDVEDVDEIVQELEAPFFEAPLQAPGEEWNTVTVDRLVRFFRNPCRYLLRERLGIFMPEGEDELDDDEPFLPDRRARNALAGRVVPLLLEGNDLETVRTLARGGIEYPAGAYGEQLLDQELAAIDAFARAVRARTAEPALDPVTREVELVIDGRAWKLQGALSDLRPRGLVRHRYDDVRPVDYLAGWIEHLFLNAIDSPAARQTVWLSRDGAYVLPPVEHAHDRLVELLTLYAQGLRTPLHFYPRSAWALVAGGGLRAAESKWFTRPNQPYRQDDHDPSYRLCLRGVENPLDEAFERCAHLVLDPLVATVRDPRLEKA